LAGAVFADEPKILLGDYDLAGFLDQTCIQGFSTAKALNRAYKKD
jgi:hypothetical protein